MTTEDIPLNIDDASGLAAALDLEAAHLDAGEPELVLDFSAVSRIDTGALTALENLLRAAGEKGIRVSLRGVNVAVYKVLKLTKVAQRLSFVN
jgi:anti-anti-sigma regulatory factor